MTRDTKERSDGEADREAKESNVSRRQFVEAAAASGVGLTGYAATADAQSNKTTIRWASDTLAKENSDKIQQALYDAGLSKDIEIEVIAGAWGGGRRSQYQQWLSAGRKNPDLFMMDTGWTIPFIARNQVADLSQRLPEEKLKTIKNQYFDAAVSSAQAKNGNIYGVPLFVDLPTMQYNKNFVRKAGYGQSDFETWATDSMTWQQFSKITKQAKQQSDAKFGFSFQAKAYGGLSCCDFNEFMSSWGGAYFGNPKKYLFGPVGERPVTVDEQQVVNATKMVRTFIHGSDAPNTSGKYAGNISPTAVLQWSEEPSRKPFTNENAVMHRNWPYSININGAKDVLGKDLGVMPLPYAKTEKQAKYPMTGGPVAALGGWHMTLNPNSTKKQAATEVLQAMMNESFRLALFEIVGWIPPDPSLLDTKRARQVPVMGRYLQQLQIAGKNAVPRPVTPVWPTESSKIAQQVNGALSQGGNPNRAMTQLKAQLNAIEQNA